MKFREDRRASDWLGKALCRRYAVVHLAEFHVLGMVNDVPLRQTWCWALALFTPDEFDILGAWPTDTGAVDLITEDLRDRGVLSIRVLSIADAKGLAPPLSLEPWTARKHAQPRVLAAVGSQAISGAAIECVPSAAIRSTLAMAGRIHDSLVRGARARSPFASSEAAAEFIAGWLQKAERRLYEARRPALPVVAHAA